MAVNPSVQTFTPHEAAQMIGTGAHNVRRWCEWHADHLSEGANPGQDKPRRLTARDVEVLKTVNDLRKQGLQTLTINEQLSTMTFAIVDTESLQHPIMPSQAAQEGQGGPPTALQVVEAINAIESRVEARVKALEGRQRDNVLMFLYGFLASAALFGLILLLMILFR
jgi:hypothetical protein